MVPSSFDYYRASSVQEAVNLLQQHSGAKLLAGGHSLIPMMKLRLAEPEALIDIGRVAELSGITQSDGRIRIGAMTTHAGVVSSSLLKEKCPILSEAASKVADPQVRNKGTIGGNLAHADPGSDLPGVVLALQGVLHTIGPMGSRQIPASDFFTGLLSTDLQPNEVLVTIDVPTLSGRTGSAYLKFENPASGYAICGAAAIVRLNDDGTCQSARLCFNGVSDTPYDASAVTNVLTGLALDDAAIDGAINAHLMVDDPMGDIYASGPYRAELAKVFGKRALKMARDRAG